MFIRAPHSIVPWFGSLVVVVCCNSGKDAETKADAGGGPDIGTGSPVLTGPNAAVDGSRGGATGLAPATGSSTGSSARGGAPDSSQAGGAAAGAGGANLGASGAGGGAGPLGNGTSQAAAVAAKLGRPARFLVGMGNDLDLNHDKDGAYTLGITLDMHYAYLVGLPGSGGWPDWNAGGGFVNILTDTAKKHGVVPMFTLYAMAARGESNAAVLTDDSYMKPYWDGAKLLFQRLAVFGDPAIVHFEPDWWAFAQQKSDDPSKLPTHVTTLSPDCAGLQDNMAGMGKCLVLLARKYAPKAIIGFHASVWAASDAAKIAAYLVKVGASEADIVVADMLDRDAGCFEAHTDPNCQRGGDFYWDETNVKSPNFHEYLAWSKGISQGVGKPILWWQVPFGVPSTTSGGTPEHYRDNRVKYIFEHVDEFVAAGGLGAAFGVGAGNQTYITTDGGQFKNAVTKYFASPVALP